MIVNYNKVRVMKKLGILFLSAIFMSLIFTACGEKKQIIEITDLSVYNDAATGFSIKYPVSWQSHNNLGERFLSYTTRDVLGRFKDFATEGVQGARIDFQVVKLAEGQTIDTVMSRKMFDESIYSKPEVVTIDGVKGFKQVYSFPLKDGTFNGEIYYAQKDPNLVAVIAFEAFAGGFEYYKDKFAEILSSVVLPAQASRSDTVKKVVEAEPPSNNLVTYNGEGFSIKISDNFDVKRPKTGSYKFEGERRGDCYILVDITDASKQTDLEKIVQDNKANFGGKDAKATTLGGRKAYVFQYSPGGNINRKAYFAIKESKLFRIIVDWNRVEDKDMFIPIFEKSVASFEFK